MNKMRRQGAGAQASFEFIMILATVSVLALSAIIMYNGLAVGSKSALHGMSSMAVNAPDAGFIAHSSQRPAFDAYMPINSSLGLENEMQVSAYGCANGSVQYSMSSNSIAFSQSNASAMLDGIYAAGERFVPSSEGVDTATVHYSVECSNATADGTKQLTTYAAMQQGNGGNQTQTYYALIYSRNESLDYPVGSSEYIYNFSQSNHCTKTLWPGDPLLIAGQCGTANAFQWMSFDGSCLAPWWSYQRTYCIVPYASDYSIFAGSRGVLTYSFTLKVGTPAGTLVAHFNGSNSSNVYLDGKDAGTAKIVNTYYGAAGGEAAISNGTALMAVNYTLYINYEQTKSSSFATLSYYNNSGSGSEMEQAVYAYDKSAASLEGSASKRQDSCASNGSEYVCPASMPFDYTIDVTTSEPMGNETISYEGSIINLNS